ncbi:MAG: AraC family transcriptional regulator [Flammeovirgaceae bacterium]|nr:AraC family transcriptional regulator [Flammeovirgaceae bacterium]
MNTPLTLTNPQTGVLAFKVSPLQPDNSFDHIQRFNYFSILWIKKGTGKYKADFSEYEFASGTMLFFSPYQPFMLMTESTLEGVVMNFHPDFFCIIKHQKEVACNGVLFNNIYQPPSIKIPGSGAIEFERIIDKFREEMIVPSLAQYESLVSYLKIFLIHASRIKVQQHPQAQTDFGNNKQPFVLQRLKDLIEVHYKEKHSPAAYADLLSLTPKALGKLSKTHFNKTLTELIHERIVIEAKRELYLTDRSVKEIAYELGFEDEYYFSRFFKKSADVSPQLYRDTVGFNRAGNLSMT